MTDIAETDNPESVEEVQETTTALPTLAEIQAQRNEKLQKLKNPEKEPEPEEEAEDEKSEEVEAEAEEPEKEEEAEEVEETEEQDEEEEEKLDVLSQFRKASEKEKEAIFKELSPETAKAFAEKRKAERELKSKLEAAEAALKEAQSVATKSNTPYGAIHTEADADNTIQAIESNIERFQDMLIYESETDYVDDKEVKGIRVNGQFVTVADVKKWVADQKENIKKVSDRKREILKNAELFQDEDVEIEGLKQKLGMDSTEQSKFEELVSDPSFSAIKVVKPEYAKKLFEIFANSVIAGRKATTRKAPQAKNEKATLPKGSPSNTKSIVSHKQKLQDIVSGKTGANLQERLNADRQLRKLNRN